MRFRRRRRQRDAQDATPGALFVSTPGALFVSTPELEPFDIDDARDEWTDQLQPPPQPRYP